MESVENNVAETKVRTGLATISLSLGLISVCTLGLLEVGGIASIVTGVLAISRFRRDPARYGGFYLALSGLILGCVSLLLSVVAAPLIMIFLIQPSKWKGLP